MTDSPQIRTEVDGRVLKIVVDNVRKKNAFVPEMMVALSQALTAFDRDDEQAVVGNGRSAAPSLLMVPVRPEFRMT